LEQHFPQVQHFQVLGPKISCPKNLKISERSASAYLGQTPSSAKEGFFSKVAFLESAIFREYFLAKK